MTIVAALELHANQVTATSTLVEIVGPGEPPATAVAAALAFGHLLDPGVGPVNTMPMASPAVLDRSGT